MATKGQLHSTWTRQTVEEKLSFAAARLLDLQNLNCGDLAGAPPSRRQQLVQEFFFHLAGAIQFLAQEVNIALSLGVGFEQVSPGGVINKLPLGHPVRQHLSELHPPTHGKSLPSDPYSDEGSHFRILLFRNFVSHIGMNPFILERDLGLSATYAVAGQEQEAAPTKPLTIVASKARLFLDPREMPSGTGSKSKKDALAELQDFLALVKLKCTMLMDLLP